MKWEAVAEYENGTTIRKYFAYDEDRDEQEQQYKIEAWLVERDEICTWYSVDVVFD